MLGDPEDRHFSPFILDNPIRKIIDNPRKIIKRYIKEGDYVADIGAGPGVYTIELAKLVGEKGKVYASDSDPKMVQVLKKKINKLNLKNVIVELASADNIKFIESNTIDFAFSNGVLCCMVNHKGAIEEINRILKEKGIAFISVEKISKGPTAIPKNEWRDLINKFNIIEEREGLFNRYAIISK
ncbi:methylase involved in ubiquinone/menaquinone biosynthesis [Caldisphaera lagunensis DSM 15908]|uniref:Arsenite methyltransferase n=1 Tax=Caldisphaera lagunensis (strain DSM 15908 / JCM 11604 / ANMR 0165 / IC-154) TaxID=1056495 RepID=L0AA00_CALLD|nr:class I SAM-dependent methyltransferase [Caldisphaera lagunensis]AFZ69880.1 methylase involved in ubiquinone/menaquinone biosynthesis [Caldisphaera lagunensis DSM 15908]